ncbi:MFS transporter [Nonomuraea diastatica]|uniref:MFS transporter n=1 Tax=Nonomuraea diastatica TaxID=1848329 RepID=A0A4R4W3I4_9ACTN|nr:MFS transporter [Nonomuraea diastatica]TDD12441.1 MFS transporter [Nonomuraea diastatica]
MLRALRVRDFRLLWAARAVAGLGTSMLVVAIPAHVFAVTGSVLATGVTLAFEYLPSLLLGPFAGVLADRWDRRRLMVATDLVHVLAISVALLARTPETIWLVYVAVLGQGTAAVFFRPAAQAHIPAVVGTGPALTSANALSAVTTGVIGLGGPPLGGLLFAFNGIGAVVAASAAAGLLSAATIAMTSARPRDPGTASRNVLAGARGIGQGLRHIGQAAATRGLLATNSLYLLANAALTALLVPFGVTRLGGSVEVGYLLSALGLGFLLGAPLSHRLADRHSARTTVAAGQALVAAAFALLFNSTALPLALVAALLLGLPAVTVLVSVQSWVQRTTPEGLLGRVTAAFLTMEAAATMFGAFAGPAVSELFGMPAALNAACVVALVSAPLTLWLVPRWSGRGVDGFPPAAESEVGR